MTYLYCHWILSILVWAQSWYYCWCSDLLAISPCHPWYDLISSNLRWQWNMMQSNFSLQTGLFSLPCMSEFIEHQPRNRREKTLSIYMMTCCSEGSCPGLAFVPLQKPIQRHKTKSPTKKWRSWSPEAVSSCLIASVCTNMSLLRETGLQTGLPSPTSHGRDYLWPWG